MLLAKVSPSAAVYLGPYLQTIEQIRDWISLAVAVASYPLFLAGYIDTCSTLILSYLLIDLPFVSSWDFLFHHAAAGLTAASCFPLRAHPGVYEILNVLFKLEVSTVFLKIGTLAEKRKGVFWKRLYTVCFGIFVLTFFQFRTYEFTRVFLQIRPLQIMNDTQESSFYRVPLGYLSLVILCGLNLYWSALILKKVGRMTGILPRSQGIREIKSS